MNNERHISKLDIIIQFIRNIKSIIALIILFIINFNKLEDHMLVWAWTGAAIILLLNLTFSYLSWKKFTYSLEKDKIVICKGIFQKEEKTIYYRRIHSVNVQQPLLLRLFGVANLQIETPGGKPGVAEAELRVLRYSYAQELQEQLRNLRANSVSEATSETANEDPLGNQNSLDIDEAVNHLSEQNHTKGLPSLQEASRTKDKKVDYQYRLDVGQLFKASFTSLNISVALIFIFGIYSFADDVLEMIKPNLYDQLLNDVVNQYTGLSVLSIVGLVGAVIMLMWLLSIILYVIKFGDYQIERQGKQISVSYGWLEKKSFVFDQDKIQAVIMEENPLRQWLGFAELKVQVITSSATEQLVIHPYIRKRDIVQMMEQFLPQRQLDLREQLHAPPAASLSTYAIGPMIYLLFIVGVGIWIWQWNGLWLLLLTPVLLLWSWLCLRAAGVWLEDGKLILRKRKINRVTYFVERKNIITVQIKSTFMQRKRKVSALEVQVLGSAFAYRVKGVLTDYNLRVWKWFSRRSL